MSKKTEITFRPLEAWPRPFTEGEFRKRNPFQNRSFSKNIVALRNELSMLGATMAVVQTAHKECDIRASDGPRVDRAAEHPGVIVAADTKYGSLKFICDDCSGWVDNIRAIVLTMERLRLADRYGVTKRGEQYLGWKMLPGPISMPVGGTGANSTGNGSPQMNVEQAAALLAERAGIPAKKIIEARGWFEQAYRDAAKQLHPDKARDDGKWQQLQDAKTLLDSLHNRK